MGDGMTPYTLELKTHELLRKLRSVVCTQKALDEWMDTKHEWLGMRTPWEAIDDGDIETLLDVAEQLNSGEPRS